jgi:hypothetical protein
MQRFSRVLALLAFPSLVLLWCVGWLLYWTGSLREVSKSKKSSTFNDLEMFVSVPEEKNSDKNVESEMLEA